MKNSKHVRVAKRSEKLKTLEGILKAYVKSSPDDLTTNFKKSGYKTYSDYFINTEGEWADLLLHLTTDHNGHDSYLRDADFFISTTAIELILEGIEASLDQ